MATGHVPYSANSLGINKSRRRTVVSYERELSRRRHSEIELRRSLARGEVLLRQKEGLIQHHALLGQEV